MLAAESPVKLMKNAVYFTSEALFFLKIFKFFSSLFGHVAERLDKRDQVNFKIYGFTAWLPESCNIYILSNISRIERNQTMKFGQLIECNMRKVFLEKL